LHRRVTELFECRLEQGVDRGGMFGGLIFVTRASKCSVMSANGSRWLASSCSYSSTDITTASRLLWVVTNTGPRLALWISSRKDALAFVLLTLAVEASPRRGFRPVRGFRLRAGNEVLLPEPAFFDGLLVLLIMARYPVWGGSIIDQLNNMHEKTNLCVYLVRRMDAPILFRWPAQPSQESAC
jgi:hypothetical protein